MSGGSRPRQEGLLRDLGIEAPPDMPINRELHVLRQKKRAYDESMRMAREQPAKREEALEGVRANRLSAEEDFLMRAAEQTNYESVAYAMERHLASLSLQRHQAGASAAPLSMG